MPRTTNHSTRERILVTTLELMERAEGAEGVTMRRVATSVGVTAMAIYKHFGDREALLQAATTAAKQAAGSNARYQHVVHRQYGLMSPRLDQMIQSPRPTQPIWRTVTGDGWQVRSSSP
jgi:AcrR family transcriptional regulator